MRLLKFLFLTVLSVFVSVEAKFDPEMCWAYGQNFKECVVNPECQWCDQSGLSTFCAPPPVDNCVNLQSSKFIEITDYYNLSADRQCLMTAAKALYDQRADEIYTGDYNKRWDGIFDGVMPPSAPKYSDCSSAVSWIYWTCFHSGPDFINGENWNDGYTGTLDQHGTKISLSQAQPGDLVFYGNPIDHVAIYIGSGRVVSHGSDPVCNCPVNYRSDLAEVRTYLSSSIEEVDCDNLNREQCLEHPKECIYISCSYGCPGCIFRNETSTLVGSIQTNLQHSTSDYWGKSTSSGPDGGVEACAWAVNNIISNAGYRRVGDNPDYVPSVVDALKAGRGRQIQAIQAVSGDLVVACGEQHIGVCMEDHCNTIDSNSSSRKCFCWRSGFNFDNYFNCGPATYWRLDN